MRRFVATLGLLGLLGLLGPAALPLSGCGKGKVKRGAATKSPPVAGKPEGKRCKSAKECLQGLKCVNDRCTDFSGKHPACRWSLSCMAKLATRYHNTQKGYELSRWLKKLSKAPYKSDCKEMPKRIAYLLYRDPYTWKSMCGPPPVKGVKRTTAKSNPFRINDKQIKAANIPQEEKAEVHKKHLAYPDLCKAWVDFTLTRPFQGWVVAKVHEQYDCDAKQYKARLKDPNLKPKCKSRLYSRDDRRYLFLHDKGAKFSVNFYFSTPPEVCKKPNLNTKTHKSGCFCLGIDPERLTLEFIEDPFLYLDELKKPH